MVTESGFPASHVEQLISFVLLGLVVGGRKGRTEMHRTKSIQEGVYLLRLQLIEAVPIHGMEDLDSADNIDVGVVKPGREHDHIMI